MVQRYFDGLYHSDANGLAQVFHPQAHYVCATPGDWIYRTMEEYLPIVAARPSPASRHEKRNDKIETISITGLATAFAKVHCSIGEKYFTDLLILVHSEGEWRIISKVFEYEIVAIP